MLRGGAQKNGQLLSRLKLFGGGPHTNQSITLPMNYLMGIGQEKTLVSWPMDANLEKQLAYHVLRRYGCGVEMLRGISVKHPRT